MTATHLAFDDTDSPEGMCTTYLAVLMLKALRGYNLIGLPRLVRLNPNVPWKTRGNAAICLSLGTGRGATKTCGEIDGEPVMYHEHGTPAKPEAVIEVAAKVLEREAEFECEKTNPGVVCSNYRPPHSLYWRAVRGIVQLDEAEALLADTGAHWRKYKNGRGIIGAASAMSWRPRDRTWEVIAYRNLAMVGKNRDIDPESVVTMDRSTHHTFNNYDYDNGHVAIAPASPCPVLFGIRGDSASELQEAKSMIRGEAPASWLLFLTNQGTDDHIVPRRIRGLSAGLSVRVRGSVTSSPRTIEGGHVILRITDGSEIDAAFYEPSGTLRKVARELMPGDQITIFGAVRDHPRSINVEKVLITQLVQPTVKVSNPKCPECSKNMGSLGAGQGFRCKKCGKKASEAAAEKAPLSREIDVGWYEPPVASRRHLYMPVRRLSRDYINNLL